MACVIAGNRHMGHGELPSQDAMTTYCSASFARSCTDKRPSDVAADDCFHGSRNGASLVVIIIGANLDFKS